MKIAMAVAWTLATVPGAYVFAQVPAPAAPAAPAASAAPASSAGAAAAVPASPRPAAPRAAPAERAPDPAVDTSAAPLPDPAPVARPSSAGPRAARAMDRVDLETSQITGNRELPRVLYVVPWRAPDAGDLEGRPVNSLLYELTRPVDRDVFRRENRYFDALQRQSAATAAPGSQPGSVAAPGPEK